MNNRYVTMKRLRDDMYELFQLCGESGELVEVTPAPALFRLMEKLIRDDGLYNYLEGLNVQVKQAIQAMKDKQLDNWNNQQNESRIVELEQALEQERNQTQTTLEQERSHAQEAEKKLRLALQEEQERNEQFCKEQLSMIKDLISLRDKLLLRKSWLEDQAPDEANAQKLVISQLRETARFLTQQGVEILEEEGIFDSQYQTVVETRPAENSEQVGLIAETFRPGYRFRGDILRPQEVVLFAAP